MKKNWNQILLAMNIRGINKFTLIDYPEKVACTIFTGGCNFLCPYCHNPCLVIDPESQPLIEEKNFLSFLDIRLGKLDAIVISGGEPTLRKRIFGFASEIKKRGFLIKIDTNGSNPEIIEELYKCNLIDLIGIDYKAPQAKYNSISGVTDLNIYKRVTKTILCALGSGIKYNIRTTVHKSLLSEADILAMRTELDSLGVNEWTLQQFNVNNIIDEDLNKTQTYSDNELTEIALNLCNTRAIGTNHYVYRS